jgi:hypothetical protein
VYYLLDSPPDKTKNEARKQCKLKEHNGQIHVKGLRELQVRSVDEARQVLRYGARHRQVAETMSNDVSSRRSLSLSLPLPLSLARSRSLCIRTLALCLHVNY